jgi:hypothetical protein
MTAAEALALSPDLHFDFQQVYIGADVLTIAYRNHRGQDAAETWIFGRDGLVHESAATYA